MSQTPMVPGTKYQDAKRPGHGLSLPPIVLAAICLGRHISRRQMSQRLMSRSQKSWPGNVPGAKSPNANCPKRQMSAGKCLSADGEPPFVSLPLQNTLAAAGTTLFHLFSRAKPNTPAEKDSTVDGKDAKQTLEFKEESSNGDKEEEKTSAEKDEVKKEDVKSGAKPAGRVINPFLLCTTP